MAETNNPLFAGVVLNKHVSNKKFVIKKRKGKTFLSKYPDMTNVKPSPLQLEEKSRFARAVKYAQEIVKDPVRKAAYKAHPGYSVYHSAIKDYMQQ
ncbi:hypothetical protein [Chitinophaga pinensis]|uniref:Uncharacterized protein n=1 Tax=Chitinophaga pinensis TaxID=79329 RepID=A0A5C6LS24_9BACT|nr:hypothetical protein [Chitinophaga pinensis]TWV99426.1 hypothetical protein FEF09_16945 [Chitinophaga pinensis]